MLKVYGDVRQVGVARATQMNVITNKHHEGATFNADRTTYKTAAVSSPSRHHASSDAACLALR